MMTEHLILEIRTICFTHIISIILATILLVVFYYKAYNEKSIKALLVVQLSMIFWMIFKIFKTVSPTVEIRWSFVVAYYICTCILEVAFLEFAYTYNTGKRIDSRIKVLLNIVATFQAIVVITNPYHHLFYKVFTFRGDTFGPLFYVHSGIIYTFVFIGFVYCYKTFQRRFKNKNLLSKLVTSAAIVLPLLMNILYITKWLHRFVSAVGIPVIFDVTPIVFSWSFLIFVYATFNNNLLDLTPLLRREVVYKLNTPIIVLDSGYYVVFYNEKVKELFEDKIEDALKTIVNYVKEGRIDRISVIDKTIELKVEKVDLLEENQYLVVFHDLSSYESFHEELSINKLKLQESNEQLNITIAKQEELSKDVAKKYVARELHDIVGHSLVVSIKLLEVAKLYINKDRKLAAKEINDASTVLNEGIVKMNNISDNNQNEYYGVALRKFISKELKYPEAMGIDVKLIVTGEAVNLEAKIFDTIAKVTSELITNTLKHAKAQAIFVNITLSEDSITMLYMDDGVGCKKLQLGNGLKGIEARIKEQNGNVYYNTSINNGFMTKIRI